MTINQERISELNFSTRTVSAHHPTADNNRRPGRSRLLFAVALCCAILLLAACGPEKSAADDELLLADTQRIAQEFAASGDVEQARSQLGELNVANGAQWLVFVTENAIARNPDAAPDLVRLSEALGLESSAINSYAVQNNLLAGASSAVESAQPTATVAPLAVAVAPQNEDAGNPTTADQPAGDSPTTDQPADETAPAAAPAAEAADGADDPSASQSQVKTAVELPTATPAANPKSTTPMVRATLPMNVRSGPGVTYPIIGALEDGKEATITAKNPAGDWWEVQLENGGTGWVYGQLVETSGDAGAIAVAANIPPPPEPTATPEPVAEAPPADAEPETPAVDPNAPPHFTLVGKRLWDVYENGGRLDGPSVTCGEKRQLVVEVIDANGAPINGVVVRAQLGAKEAQITGDKGPGRTEFVLGGGQELKVEKDAGGRDATSDVAYGMTTHPAEIPIETLIGARYCADAASCPAFQAAPGCWGHYSWTVTFQRNY